MVYEYPLIKCIYPAADAKGELLLMTGAYLNSWKEQMNIK
jgi:hypothetical protein